MKKTLFAAMLLVASAFTFVACDKTDEMSNEELANVLLENETYGGTDSDGDYLTMLFTAPNIYELFYGESKKDKNYEEFSAGTWTVENPNLILQDLENPQLIMTMTLSDNGKTIDFKNGKTGEDAYSFTLKKIKNSAVTTE